MRETCQAYQYNNFIDYQVDDQILLCNIHRINNIYAVSITWLKKYPFLIHRLR